MRRLRDLKGLGRKSEEMLAEVGINTIEEFISRDTYEIYRDLKNRFPNTSVNFLYAMMGAKENRSWLEISKDFRTEILLRLDDMGIAPK